MSFKHQYYIIFSDKKEFNSVKFDSVVDADMFLMDWFSTREKSNDFDKWRSQYTIIHVDKIKNA